MMEMGRVWPIVVEFGVGAALSAVGLWCGWRSNYLDMRLPDDRRTVAVIVAGFLGLLALSAIFTFWLPNIAISPETSTQ